jgi:hypothetical protein
VSGVVYFSDGVSQFQGGNVIARAVDDPSTAQDESRRVAVSSVSGYLFTGNPGQSVTANMPGRNENNSAGNRAGTRDPQKIGYYQLNLPPGTYTVEVESIFQPFMGGSGIGPLPFPVQLPGPAEFWNIDESAFDIPLQRDTITVHAGENITGINIILNGTPSRFDDYEDSGTLLDPPLPSLTIALAEVSG